jgi:hypothetical protein
MDVMPPTDVNGLNQFIDFITKKVPQITRDQFGIGRSKVFVKDSETLFVMEDMLEKKMNPEAYKTKVEAFKGATLPSFSSCIPFSHLPLCALSFHPLESERKAKRLHGVKGKCLVM